MEWIDIEIDYPNIDKILCYGKGQIFICELVESSLGNFYQSINWEHGEYQNSPEVTHWMPLPKPPENYGMD